MTTPRDNALEALTGALDAGQHLAEALVRLAAWWRTRDPQTALTNNDRDVLHGMLRRFEQLYDLIGRQILRALLLIAGEDPKEFTLRQLFRWAESREALPNAEDWIDAGVVRNRLVHDYPIGVDLQIEHVDAALDKLPVLLDALAAVDAAAKRIVA